jgi:hypothetical protein
VAQDLVRIITCSGDGSPVTVASRTHRKPARSNAAMERTLRTSGPGDHPADPIGGEHDRRDARRDASGPEAAPDGVGRADQQADILMIGLERGSHRCARIDFIRQRPKIR